ncbi:MAG TPA: non-ribosomal peptide synthetase, partial [Candidatus Dormibacteraeota bacterium]|nr:non-ribosomal peptide synthetase [Candidatus Dormibacteraeota bacterium]
TSGSTGRPKGTGVTHGALANFLGSMEALLGTGAADRWAAVASASFDISTLELFLPLVTGARVVLYDRLTARDPLALARRLEADEVTVLQSTPSLWQVLVDSGWAGSPRLLALSGGEPMTPALAAALRARVRVLWNAYGPTETTVYSTATPVDDTVAIRPEDTCVWIGPPIARTWLHILDAALEPVPVGVFGEVCIAGDGLARGYLDRPSLTAERFVPDPFGDAPGGRMYRSGDVGRARSDGTIELRGRTDHQVKVRGYRIELGEVETALRLHPDVVAAVATVRDGQLVAHVVASVPDVELKRFLRERLPEYMVPSAIVAMSALPLTARGKVDRRALPDPPAGAAAARIAPRTAVEDAIAAIWCSTLGLAEVGIDDNFFDVGGHSIRLVAVQGELAQAFSVEVPLTVLFQRPTVRALAEHLTGGAEPGLERRLARGAARRAASSLPLGGGGSGRGGSSRNSRGGRT